MSSLKRFTIIGSERYEIGRKAIVWAKDAQEASELFTEEGEDAIECDWGNAAHQLTNNFMVHDGAEWIQEDETLFTGSKLSIEAIIRRVQNGEQLPKKHQVRLGEDDSSDILPDDTIPTSLGYTSARAINAIGIAHWWTHDDEIVEGCNSTILLCNGNVLHVQSVDIEDVC